MKTCVGIDVAKLTLDVAVLLNDRVQYHQVNSDNGAQLG